MSSTILVSMLVVMPPFPILWVLYPAVFAYVMVGQCHKHTDAPELTRSNFLIPLEPQMRFLTEELGVTDAQSFKMVLRSPPLLSYSTESMRGKFSYFREELHLNDGNVRTEPFVSLPDRQMFQRHSLL